MLWFIDCQMPWYCRLVEMCTSKDPSARPSFTAVIQMLEEVFPSPGRAACPVCWFLSKQHYPKPVRKGETKNRSFLIMSDATIYTYMNINTLHLWFSSDPIVVFWNTFSSQVYVVVIGVVWSSLRYILWCPILQISFCRPIPPNIDRTFW